MHDNLDVILINTSINSRKTESGEGGGASFRASRLSVPLMRLVALPGSAACANAGPPTLLLPRGEMQPHAHMISPPLGFWCPPVQQPWVVRSPIGGCLTPWPNYGFTMLNEPPRWLCDLFWERQLFTDARVCGSIARFSALQIIFDRPCALPYKWLFFYSPVLLLSKSCS